MTRRTGRRTLDKLIEQYAARYREMAIDSREGATDPGMVKLLTEFAAGVRRTVRHPLPPDARADVSFTGAEASVMLTLLDNLLSAPTVKLSLKMLGSPETAAEGRAELAAARRAERKLQKALDGGTR